MEQYSHYEYGELLANKLKPISHTPEHPHFFTAFGFEIYSDLRISSQM